LNKIRLLELSRFLAHTTWLIIVEGFIQVDRISSPGGCGGVSFVECSFIWKLFCVKVEGKKMSLFNISSTTIADLKSLESVASDC
jgi:hypothetical protein